MSSPVYVLEGNFLKDPDTQGVEAQISWDASIQVIETYIYFLQVLEASWVESLLYRGGFPPKRESNIMLFRLV